MKATKHLRILIGICFFILCILFAVNIVTPSVDESFHRRYTFVCPLQWDNAASGIKDADQQFHTNTKLIGMKQLDVETQAKAIQDAVLAKVDGIITAAAANSQVLQDAVDQAEAQGIPVVVIDNDISKSRRSCYIGTDNRKAGALAGREMFQASQGKANIGIITASLNSPNQVERIEGFCQQIEDYPEMSVTAILECHSDKLEVKEKIPRLLKENPQINALYLTEAISSSVTGGILKDEGIIPGQLCIVAFDRTNESMDYFQEGFYHSLIVQKPYTQGYLAVQILNDLLDGKEVEDVIYTSGTCINQSNYQAEDTEQYIGLEWYMY